MLSFGNRVKLEDKDKIGVRAHPGVKGMTPTRASLVFFCMYKPSRMLYQREWRKKRTERREQEKIATKAVRSHNSRIQQRLTKYKYDAVKLRSLIWELPDQDARQILAQPCHYCGEEKAYGIDRVDNTVGYTLANCVPCCTFCNMAKRTYTYAEFQAHLARVARFVTNKIAI